MRRSRPALGPLALALASLPALALAQQAPPAAPAPEAKQEEKKPEKPPRWTAVRAGEVYTVTHGVLRDVTILAKDGRITAIARDLKLPDKTEVIDASARRVYPGLVAYNSFGIVGSPPQDATDVFSLNMVLALSQGITSVGFGETVAKLTYGTLEGHVLGQRTPVLNLTLRSAQMKARLRDDLDKVRDYQREVRAHKRRLAEGDTKSQPPKPLTGRQAGYLKLLEGELWAHVRADEARDLAEVCDLAEVYGFKVMIEGAAEGWTMAGRLGRLGCRAIVSPRDRRPEDPSTNRPNGWSIENAAILHKSGVPVVLMSEQAGVGLWGLAGRDLFTLPLEGAFAVRGGLPAAEALKALTLNPARFMGVDDQIGSIEVGKDMDLVVTSGDLLHYRTLPELTIVNGRVAYDRSKDSLLRAVPAPGKEPELPVLWPRRPGSKEPEMPKAERD
ncbi:MAG: amidohydrolase family protein [Planctomycetota bacterium]